MTTTPHPASTYQPRRGNSNRSLNGGGGEGDNDNGSSKQAGSSSSASGGDGSPKQTSTATTSTVAASSSASPSLPPPPLPSNNNNTTNNTATIGSTVTSTTTTNNNNNNNNTPSSRTRRRLTIEEQHQQHSSRQNEDKRVRTIRLLLTFTLLTATTLVAVFAYRYVSKDELQNFETQYRDSVSKVAEAFQHRVDTKNAVAETFSAMITSRYGNAAQAAEGREPLWPNVTIPDFQEQVKGSLAIADGRALSFNPIITQGVNRLQFEEHATKSAWILGSDQLITPPPDSTFPDNRTVAFGIYSRDANRQVVYDPGYAPDSEHYKNVMVPVWQIAPIVTNEKAVMFNLHSEKNRMNALDHMMYHKVPSLTQILQLVQDVELRPSSILFYPVFDRFKKKKKEGDGNYKKEERDGGGRMVQNVFDDEQEEEQNELLEDSTTEGGSYQQGQQPSENEQTVVGSVSIVFSWDTFLNKILPDYIKGMVCVLQSSTNQKFSYSISGDTVTLLGEGDLHDPAYDSYGQHVEARLLLEGGDFTHTHDEAEDDDDESREEEEKFITYQLHMYPSAEFEAQYVSNRAGIYAATVVLIFLFTAFLFVLYDYLVEDRQKRTARLAIQRGNIVDGLFPAAFRDRLYRIHTMHHVAANDSSMRRLSHEASDQGNRRSMSHDSRSSISGGNGSNPSDRGVARSTSSAGGGGGNGSGGGGGDHHPPARRRNSHSHGGGDGTSTSGSVKSSSSFPRQMSTIVMGTGNRVKKLRQIDKFMHGLGLKSSGSNGGAAMSSMMNDGSGGQGGNRNNDMGRMSAGLDDEPIAELFQDTSIMFSDIVGFTKWSSDHTPNQVFRLLEQIFWEFDSLATLHNVFKLGTIGDCYIAVTGIPDPVQDHATVLTQFAFDARDKVREVCARLEGEGLDTGSLDMRFGIHSGATTAGILRGTKSRFELFGDTINTASRMESTGLGGKIQVSEETAELIRQDGVGRWLTKRKTLVKAKGKGDLQTYWVEPESEGRRVSFSEKVMGLNFNDDAGGNNNNSFRRNSSSRSDRYYQNELTSSFSSCGGQLPQCDEEKLEESSEHRYYEEGMMEGGEPGQQLQGGALNDAVSSNNDKKAFARSLMVEPSLSWRERPSMTTDEDSSVDKVGSKDKEEDLQDFGTLNMEASFKPARSDNLSYNIGNGNSDKNESGDHLAKDPQIYNDANDDEYDIEMAKAVDKNASNEIFSR